MVAYERELIGLVQAIRHWRLYLWECRFLIHTNHYRLKFLLDQHVSMISRHQWINKLFSFDFAVEYRSSNLNTVANTLSCRDLDSSAQLTVSRPSFTPPRSLLWKGGLPRCLARGRAFCGGGGEMSCGARHSPAKPR